MGKKTKLGKFRKDKFYKLAKETGFRSRAAFKLIQLNRKFGFLQQSQVCIDLCAAPGGWMQVAKQNMPVSSIVVGVDLFPIRHVAGCISLIEDITTDKCKMSISRELKTWKADVVLHDGAPNVGKNWLFDAYQQICLTLSAVKLATNFLRNGGWFVTKVFRSKDYNALLWVLKHLFKKVHATKPSASRKESAEIFVVCQGYLAPDKIDPKLLDSKYVFEELDLEDGKQSSLLHPEKQKRIKAEGYSERDIALRNDLSVTEFMQSPNGLAALQGISSITMDNDAVQNHPRTTEEILACCKDIKVLGRKDLKGLLVWWKHVKADLFKTVVENDKPVPEQQVDEETIKQREFDEIDKQVADLAFEEQQEAKRKKKKMLKERSKLNEKMNLKMIIKGDEGPREIEEEVFELRSIRTKEDLEVLQDVPPDMLAENEFDDQTILPKYKRYEKGSNHLNDEGNYIDNDDNETESVETESDYENNGLGLSDDEVEEEKFENKKRKEESHPLIKSCDYRDKDSKRKQRVQLWFEKENLQKMEDEVDEDLDLDYLAEDYKNRGIEILGKNNDQNADVSWSFGGKTMLRTRQELKKKKSNDGSSESDDDYDGSKFNSVPKIKKIRLEQEELALGAMMIKGKKIKRDLIDTAWNRYTFNDDNLPNWFVQDEDQHMRKDIPVPKELSDEYNKKVQELNVRPIKKVMEAKARKKKRALKRLTKAKKKAEQILENADASAQEKSRQLRKLYKKAGEEKKKEVSYVVSKKHLSGKRVRRPPGVKGRFKVVDPRMKKDKRSVKVQQKKNKAKKGK